MGIAVKYRGNRRFDLVDPVGLESRRERGDLPPLTESVLDCAGVPDECLPTE